MKKLTKLIVGSVAAVSLVASSLIVVNAQVGDPELDAAVTWMNSNGMTSATSASNFNPSGTLSRDQGSKFFSEYAMTNLCLVPDTTRSCSFSDLWSADPTLASYVTTSCQLGIFNGSNGVFMPTAPLTKAQFVTALIRALDGMKDENVTPRWNNYHAEALTLGITRESDAWALDRPVTRYEAALMLYRSRVDGCSATGTETTTGNTGGDDLSSILADLFGDDDTTTTTTGTTGTTTTGTTGTTTGTTGTTTTSMCSDGTPLKTVGSACDDGNANTSNDRYVDACNCGGDMTTTTTTPTTTTPTTTTTTPTNTTNTSGTGIASCNANVALNPASPAGNGQEIPGLATAVVAIFDVTATAGDLLMDNLSLQRVGLGSDDAINFVAVYTLNGSRVSNSSSFNSDDEAFISLNPKVTVPNGTTESFVIVAQIGCGTTRNSPIDASWNAICTSNNVASNQEFALRLNEFNGSCDVNVEAGEFEIAAVNAATIEIDEDGSISDVEVGEMWAEVATFTIDNTDDSDVFITAVTLRDDKNNAKDNLRNFELHSSGNVLATTATANGRYVTFQLATPFLIKDGDNEDFEVVADVVDGAGEEVEFRIERALDVSGFDDTFGYGLYADVSNYNGQNFEIQAGDLVFVNHPIPTDQTRFDKDDVVLMEFHIDVDGWSNLLLEDIAFDVYSDTPSCLPAWVDLAEDSSANPWILENIQLVDVTNGGSYNLQVSRPAGALDNCHIKVSDSGMSIQLAWVWSDHVFQLVADTADDNNFTTAQYNAILGAEFYVELRPTSTDVQVEENGNSVIVTDITPSFLSSEAIEISTSALEIDIIECGTNENVVNGGYGIELITFEIDTDDVSPVIFDEIEVSSVTNFDSQHISSVNLYRGMYPTGTLVDTETLNGSQTSVQFDSFGEILVPASSTQPMYITVDLIDDNANVVAPLNIVAAQITWFEAEDDDGDDVPFVPSANIFPAWCSPNTITILDSGTLNIEKAINDQFVQDGLNILGGESSDFVAAFDLNATNEDIRIEDMDIVVAGAWFGTSARSITVYGSDRTTVLYGPTSVTSNTINLNNIDLIIPQGGWDTIYVKVDAEKIGNNEPGAQSTASNPAWFTMSLVVAAGDATGVDSGDNMSPSTSTLTSAPSDAFHIVPVDISNVQFVNNSWSTSKDTFLSATSNVGILRITADTWTNTDTWGGDLDLAIDTIIFDEDLWGLAWSPSYTIRKVSDNKDGTFTCTAGSPAAGKVECVVNGSDDDFVLFAWEVADYVIEASGINIVTGNESVQIEIDNIVWAITYWADDTAINGYGFITPQIENDEITNQAVTANN